MNLPDVTKYQEMIVTWAIGFVPKIILAGIVLFIGLFVAKKMSAFIYTALEKAGLEKEVSDFLHSLIDILLKIVVVLVAASIVGVKMTALIGLLAAAGFAIGLALQGFLGNFAAGLTILFFRPYRIGDWVNVSDHFGKVKNIQIFNTTLETPNDKVLVIPNGQVTDNIITNFSTKGRIRLELEVHMPYEESYPKVEKVIAEALKKSNLIHHDPAPHVGIAVYDSHSITIAVRPYINPDNYWEATYDCYARIKKAFSENDIQAAYSEGVALGPIGD